MGFQLFLVPLIFRSHRLFLIIISYTNCSHTLIYKSQQQVSDGKYQTKGSKALPHHCSLHIIFLGTTHVLGTLACSI